MNFLTNLNLNKNQIQNAVIHPLSSAPANPAQFQIYTNSGDGVIYQYVGSEWKPVGALYNEENKTGVVITGLDQTGTVSTTKVIDLTLDDYVGIDEGYINAGDTVEAALNALETALKGVIAEGGEPNQNAFSNVTVKKQSTSITAVTGATADVTLSADDKTDTISVASGNKWVDIDGEGKQLTVGHALSGVTAGSYGADNRVASFTVDVAGHVTAVEEKTITPASIGADVAGAANDVLGTTSDTKDKATVYGARALAQQAIDDAAEAKTAADGKVASVSAGNGITVTGDATTPAVAVKLDAKVGNAATLSDDGLMVAIPTAAEYSIVKLSSATEGYLATYQLQKDGVAVGVNIDIPKDYLVKSASVKTTGKNDPSGFNEGTKYIDFIVNTKVGSGEESHIYLNVQDLVDVYTAGNGIEIGEDNQISVKLVSENGLSVDATGVKLSLASGTSAGAMSAAHYTKLEGIEEGATNNTIILNGTATKTPSFYAPVEVGTKGQILVSSGTGAPVFQNMPETFHKYTATNATLTAAGGAFTWSIPASTHGVSANDMIVQLFEVAGGAQVIADVNVNQTNFNVDIMINDVDGSGSLAAGKYRVVIFG